MLSTDKMLLLLPSVLSNRVTVFVIHSPVIYVHVIFMADGIKRLYAQFFVSLEVSILSHISLNRLCPLLLILPKVLYTRVELQLARFEAVPPAPKDKMWIWSATKDLHVQNMSMIWWWTCIISDMTSSALGCLYTTIVKVSMPFKWTSPSAIYCPQFLSEKWKHI